MSYGEAHRLTLILLTDPSSQVAASVRGWVHPADRTDIVLRDIYDLQHASKSKRMPKPYPRPWHTQPKKIGSGGISIEEFRAAMDAASEN